MHWLDWFFAIALFVFAALAFTNHWPPGRLGNAYQLVGLFFAALALPVLSPWLATVEVHLGQANEAAKRWLAQRRHQLRVWWARLRRKPIPANLGAATVSASASLSATLTVGHPPVDRKNIGEREWLALLNNELDALREQVRAQEKVREADRATVQGKLNALRIELQEHTLAVTREGWDYVFTGAVLTGLGIVLTLV